MGSFEELGINGDVTVGEALDKIKGITDDTLNELFTPARQMMLTCATPNVFNGVSWVFINQDEYNIVKESIETDNQILAYKMPYNMYLVEMSILTLIEDIQKIDDTLISVEDVETINDEIIRAKVRFEKYLREAVEIDGFNSRVGIYLLNDSRYLMNKGNSYRAYGINLSTALYVISKVNQETGKNMCIYVQGKNGEHGTYKTVNEAFNLGTDLYMSIQPSSQIAEHTHGCFLFLALR